MLSQPVPNSNGQFNQNAVASASHSYEHVQYIVILSSGKQFDNDVTDSNVLRENAEKENARKEKSINEKRSLARGAGLQQICA